MDIEYLLWLQNLREASGNVLTPFMLWLSDLVGGYLIILPLVMYWCINKHWGMFILLSLNIGNFVNNIIKMTFCVYRPFMRDSRIIPAAHRPSSYSFTSGHTMTAATIFGGCAVMSRKNYERLFCAVMILLVMFARNYLGVHTPQDVIAGLIMSMIILYAVNVMMSHPEHENMFAFLGILAVIAGTAYVSLKSYPEDYGIDGKLLVNAAKKIKNIYFFGGSLAGVIAGRLIERKYIRFTPAGLGVKGIILAAVGFGMYKFILSMEKYSAEFLAPFITEWGGYFVHDFLMMIFVAALWPFVIKKVCRK